jgi:hypothetical protein
MSGITFDVPNLDCESINPADYEQLAATLSLLADYANHKAGAMKFRLAGHIVAAQRIEASMERIYEQLPEWARW